MFQQTLGLLFHNYQLLRDSMRDLLETNGEQLLQGNVMDQEIAAFVFYS